MTPEQMRTYADAVHDEEVALLRTLAQIPAPTGHEEKRAAFVASWLRSAGATNVEVDNENNVLCWLAQTPGAGVEVFSAHTDVVFDDTDPLPLREEDGRLYAPGVGDDTANLVGLLFAARYLLAHPQKLEGRSVLVVANSCEEGLGNLRGTRALYDTLQKQIASHVAFDTTLGNYVSQAVGSHRWRISCTTEGGHSFKNYGRPNAISELARLIVALEGIELPSDPPCTRNVGTIEGGTTVNSIASHASMLYEHRSTSEDALVQMREQLELVVSAHQREGVTFELELIGERPGNGSMDADACERLLLLEKRAERTQRLATGYSEINHAPSSTDVNIPLSRGIPGVCVGAVRGMGAHTRGEWIEIDSLRDGLVAVLGMMCA